MTDAQAEGSTEVPAGTPPRSPLFPALQLLAFAAIAGLLALPRASTAVPPMLSLSPFLSVLSSRRERGKEMLSTRTTRPLKPLALALALAALAVPTAQGYVTPTENAQSVPLITEHSAGQNGTGQRSTAQSVPLITEHSAGQNGTGQPKTAGKYGALDPAIAAAIRTHSAAQKGVSRSAAASVSAAAPNGFKWRDAGVGAGGAFAAMLLTLGVATLIMRRGRGRLAGF